jgi:hypothetical protein
MSWLPMAMPRLMVRPGALVILDVIEVPKRGVWLTAVRSGPSGRRVTTHWAVLMATAPVKRPRRI